MKKIVNNPLLREHKAYPGMFYYKQPNGRWSKEFYNRTRSTYYSLTYIEEPKKVGQLPHGTY